MKYCEERNLAKVRAKLAEVRKNVRSTLRDMTGEENHGRQVDDERQADRATAGRATADRATADREFRPGHDVKL